MNYDRTLPYGAVEVDRSYLVRVSSSLFYGRSCIESDARQASRLRDGARLALLELQDRARGAVDRCDQFFFLRSFPVCFQ